MGKKVKAGTVAVEIQLEKDQFNKDFKQAGRDVLAEQKKLSMEMERNKVRFKVEGADQGWADRMFGSTVIGKIQNARKETAYLNEQIGFQTSKVNLARNAWASIFSRKGAGSDETIKAERSFLREQAALAGLKNELNGTASAASVMGGALRSAAMVGGAAAIAMAVAYASAVRAATAWGQAVNDIADETGMADTEAAKLLGTMHVVGLGAEEAAGAIAKLSKSVATAALAQDAANKSGSESSDVFSRYGIAIKDANGAVLSHSEIIANITSVHRSMSDGLAKTALEMEVFGRSGYKMNDLLNMTSERSAEIELKLAKMGLTVGVGSQKFEDLNQQLNEAGLALKSMALTITEDNIKSITKLVEKLTDLAIWIRENKAVIDEFGGYMGKLGKIIYPIVDGVDAVVEKLKQLAEARNKYLLEAQVNNPPGDVTDENVAAQNKAIDDARKKNNQSVLDKLKANQTVIDAARDLNTAIMELNGHALAVQLANIEKEEKKWAEKCGNEKKAAEWAAAARVKAHLDAQDRIDASLKTYDTSLKSVESAKEGITSSFSGAFGGAINQVMDNLKNNRSADAGGAVQKVREEFELRKVATEAVAAAAGLNVPAPLSPWETVDKSFTALNEAITNSDKEKINYLKVIAQNTAGGKVGNVDQPQAPREVGYKQPQYQNVDADYNVTVNVPVSIDGQQVGNAAARVIMARQGNKTSYGGGK